MRPTLIIAAAAGFAALPILSGSASAQANRTFVSGHGSDANPCTLAAPCRSFTQALSQTNAGGEITILDPAGYGTVTITKSVSIINDGVGEAGVTTSSSGDAITINAGASDVVNLRGLNLVGGGVGSNGITINSAGSVNIQNSVIRGFFGNGVNMVPSGNASSNLNVIDTTISNNAEDGILVAPSGDLAVRAVFKRVQIIGSGTIGVHLYGGSLSASGTLKGSAIDSLASGTVESAGFEVSSSQSLPTTTVFEVINCQAVDNFIGVEAGSTNSTMYLARTTISDNSAFGFSNSGTTFSFGNNYITQNANNFGSLTPLNQQ